MADDDGFRDRLRAFFAKHNPAKLANVEAISAKYAGKEAALFKALHAKYSAATALVVAAGDDADAGGGSAASAIGGGSTSGRGGGSAAQRVAAWGVDEITRLRRALEETGDEKGRTTDASARWHEVSARLGVGVSQARRTAGECAQQYALWLLEAAAAAVPPAAVAATTIAGGGATAAPPLPPPPQMLPELDFGSDHFDPFMALHCSTVAAVVPPVRRAAPLDFLGKCRCLLPARDEHHTGRVRLDRKEPRTKREGGARESARSADRRSGGVLGAIAENAAGLLRAQDGGDGGPMAAADAQPDAIGPFSVLLRCFRERRRVRVTVRRINSLHSVCTGHLRAFDKHMNVVLQNVEEVFACGPPPRRQRHAQQHQHDARPFKRRLPQILIRGDNIVLIAAMPTKAVPLL